MRIRLSYVFVLLTIVTSATTSARADFIDGRDAYLRQDYETTLNELRPLAAEGDMRAQTFLGWLYKKGYGVPQDIVQALVWYKLAADQGHGFSQKELAMAYYTGNGVPQDLTQAAMWLNLSKLRNYGMADLLLVEAQMDKASIQRARRMATDWTAQHKR